DRAAHRDRRLPQRGASQRRPARVSRARRPRAGVAARGGGGDLRRLGGSPGSLRAAGGGAGDRPPAALRRPHAYPHRRAAEAARGHRQVALIPGPQAPGGGARTPPGVNRRAVLYRTRGKENHSMAMSEDERIAYLAGEGAESLTARERAELDELRALLSAPST